MSTNFYLFVVFFLSFPVTFHLQLGVGTIFILFFCFVTGSEFPEKQQESNGFKGITEITFNVWTTFRPLLNILEIRTAWLQHRMRQTGRQTDRQTDLEWKVIDRKASCPASTPAALQVFLCWIPQKPISPSFFVFFPLHGHWSPLLWGGEEQSTYRGTKRRGQHNNQHTAAIRDRKSVV